jgi:hypothetical protein
VRDERTLVVVVEPSQVLDDWTEYEILRDAELGARRLSMMLRRGER